MKNICIQMGHVGSQRWGPGAAFEEETIQIITPHITKYLAKYGYKFRVYGGDLPPKLENFDLFISLHCDAVSATSTGFSIGVSETSPGSMEYASVLKDVYGQKTKLKFIGFNITRDEQRYYGFRTCQPTTRAVLLELGFVSNPTERAYLQQNADDIGATIVDSINRFYGIGKEEEQMFMMTSKCSGEGIKEWSVVSHETPEDYNYVSILNEDDKEITVRVHLQTADGRMQDQEVKVPVEPKVNFVTFETGEKFGTKELNDYRLTFYSTGKMKVENTLIKKW